MTTALVYLDPSPRGAWAVSLAARLPRLADWDLVLVATEEDARKDTALVERARSALAAAGGVRVAVRPGPAEAAVVAEAGAVGLDLLVVPPAGRNAIQRMLKGSRVATVVRQVATPVLIARDPPEAIRRVLVAVGGGHAAGVEAGRALAAAWGAEVRAVHVESAVALPYGRDGDTPAEDPRSAAVALARANGVELRVREGLVADGVLAEVREGGYDVLVLGSPRAADPVWGRDDVAERILVGCPVSTLVVPPTGLHLPGVRS